MPGQAVSQRAVVGGLSPGRRIAVASVPDFNGVMFWNIQADRADDYQMSNAVGPLLHGLPRR